MSGIGVLAGIFLVIFGAVFAGLVIAFILVPLLKGVGWLIVGFFRAVGWLIAHVFEYVGGTIGDLLRLTSALIAAIVLLPFAPLNVILGRWSAAGHYADSIKRECKVIAACLYRAGIRRPLKLFWLHGILEGVEQRLPEAMAAAPTSDRPGRRVGQFDGYRIVGSLPGGGSGAKLYIAEPDASRRSRNPALPERVVIKCFALTEGSSLPQIVRESRALDAARQLGLVFDHGMDAHRFFYVMPYHAGDHLGIVTRQTHGESSSDGLDERRCRTILGYAIDLVETLSMYHRGGLWHKDVKPDNVIIRDGRAYLVDLGLVTPLRSAMTLTTHGTEYFRDPEMVRQALRGVKVHQVDGAKFDIYAAGAVLYFMLENTFPAHGALSRFGKKSPESLRWIVRRGMADYQQRYATADEMLADLRAAAASSDLFAVRPAELPSMRGGSSFVAAEETPSVAAFVPPAAAAAAASVFATPAPAVAAAAAAPVSEVHAATPRYRPQLRVVNWWTGAYEVDDDGGARSGSGSSAQSRLFRQHASEMRHRADEQLHKVRNGAMSARRAAREQIREARARAQELRRRARERHPRPAALAERQPSAALAGTVVVFLLLAVGVTLVAVKSRRAASRSGATVVSVVESPGNGWLQLKGGEGEAVVLALDGSKLSGSVVRSRLKKFMASEHVAGLGGHPVVMVDRDTNRTLVELLQAHDGSECADPASDSLWSKVRELGAGGVMWVSSDPDGLSLRQTMLLPPLPPAAPVVVDGAIVPATSSRPLLLVNDHPIKGDMGVTQVVESLVDEYRRNSWNVIIDDAAEAQVRLVLPRGPINPGEPLPPRLQTVLAQLELAGVLRIDAAPGEGLPQERVRWTRIDAVPDVAADQGTADVDHDSAELSDASGTMSIPSGAGPRR